MQSSYYGINTPDLFEFIGSKSDKEFYKSAHQAITNCEMWNWLRNYDTDTFMYDNSKETKRIFTEMLKDPINNNHSGTSYGFTIRQMEYIAKNGYDHFKQKYMGSLERENLERLSVRRN